jgi:hypothetical protein
MVMQRSLILAGATLRVRCERWRTMRHLSFTQSNDPRQPRRRSGTPLCSRWRISPRCWLARWRREKPPAGAPPTWWGSAAASCSSLGFSDGYRRTGFGSTASGFAPMNILRGYGASS